jgi:transcriptional regulator with XRE-family HTH domain
MPPVPAKVDGAMLRRIRLSRGFTQAELAEKAGITVRTLSSMENGSMSSRTTVTRLAEILEVHPLWLLASKPVDLFPEKAPRVGRRPKRLKEELIET